MNRNEDRQKLEALVEAALHMDPSLNPKSVRFYAKVEGVEKMSALVRAMRDLDSLRR